MLNFRRRSSEVEVKLAVVVSLRPKGAAFGQAGWTRLDYCCCCSCPWRLVMVLRLLVLKFCAGAKTAGRSSAGNDAARG